MKIRTIDLIEMPIFAIIDEINSGNMSADDLTKEQLESLPKDVLKKAIENAK